MKSADARDRARTATSRIARGASHRRAARRAIGTRGGGAGRSARRGDRGRAAPRSVPPLGDARRTPALPLPRPPRLPIRGDGPSAGAGPREGSRAGLDSRPAQVLERPVRGRASVRVDPSRTHPLNSLSTRPGSPANRPKWPTTRWCAPSPSSRRPASPSASATSSSTRCARVSRFDRPLMTPLRASRLLTCFPRPLQACAERVEKDETGEAHCTGQVRARTHGWLIFVDGCTRECFACAGRRRCGRLLEPGDAPGPATPGDGSGPRRRWRRGRGRTGERGRGERWDGTGRWHAPADASACGRASRRPGTDRVQGGQEQEEGSGEGGLRRRRRWALLGGEGGVAWRGGELTAVAIAGASGAAIARASLIFVLLVRFAQYFDYWQCVDKCVAPKLFAKLK